MLSAICYNLDQSKIFLSGNGLTTLMENACETWKEMEKMVPFLSQQSFIDGTYHCCKRISIGLTIIRSKVPFPGLDVNFGTFFVGSHSVILVLFPGRRNKRD